MKATGQSRSDSPAGRVAPPIVHDVLRSQGRPLDREVRNQLEPRFGHDFGRVRVHTGDQAAQSAEAINARAFTTGSDIVFGRGQFTPDTQQGRTLLAHELAHTVQQRNHSAPPDALPVSEPGSRIEQEAETAATSRRPAALTASAPMIARQPAGPETSALSLEQVLTNFFKDVKTKYPKESLPQHPLVIKQCRSLTQSVQDALQMEAFLLSAQAPGEPESLAKAVVQRLGTVAPDKVERLKKTNVPKPVPASGASAAASDYTRGSVPKTAPENQQSADAERSDDMARGKESRTHVTDIPIKLDLEGAARVAEGAAKRRQAAKNRELREAGDSNALRPDYEVPPLPGDAAPAKGEVNTNIKIPSTVGTLTNNQVIQFKSNQPGSVLSSASALRAALTPSGSDAFDAVFRWLARGPEFGVQLAGMASLEGQPSHRQALGENRARSVANALFGLGIGPDRIDDVPGQAPDCTRLSFGIYNCGDMHAAKPANPNDRRVEAKLFVHPKADKQ